MSFYYRFINLHDYEEFNFVVFVSERKVSLPDIEVALTVAWQRYIELVPIPSRLKAFENEIESLKELGLWLDKSPDEKEIDHELDYLIRNHHQEFCYPFYVQQGTGNIQDWVINALSGDEQLVSNIGPSLILDELRKLGLLLIEYNGGDMTFNREVALP